MTRLVSPPQTLRGDVFLPGDKSIAHRSLILNSMAKGIAHVTNFPKGADTLSTLSCLQILGIPFDVQPGDNDSLSIDVHGNGVEGFTEPSDVLDAGNSGTTMRLISGLLAGLPVYSVLTGDDSLRNRPMGRIVEPLSQMGAQFSGRKQNNYAPLSIIGGDLNAIDYVLPVASAQVKSAVIIAGLNANGRTTIHSPSPSRNHTELMLAAMGVPIVSDNGIHIEVEPTVPRSVDVEIPGDISSAAPWIVAGLIHPDAHITVRNVGINPTRTGILDVLQRMGGTVELLNKRMQGGEEVADITSQSSDLHGTEIAGDIISILADELPLLALAGTIATGKTIIRDAQELRVKESDRIKTTVTGLNNLGARIEEHDDGMVVYGGHVPKGGNGTSSGDHRIAILLAIAGLTGSGDTSIEGDDAVSISYPSFWDEIDRLSDRPPN
jgi:3-phosphoshikimate 1-carboxyvinyltransferase